MMHRTAKTIEPMNVQSEVPGPSAQQVTAPLEPTAPTVPAENAEQTEVVSVLEPPKLAKVSTEAEPTGVTESSPTPMEDDAVPPVPADDSSKSFATAQEPKPTATANESTAPESDANDESKAAAAEAQAKMDADARTRKLEQLVASGTYAVPINAVRRKRSRTFVATMCVLALVLATLLLDVLLDVGIVDLPFSVPHTRLFSDI